MDVCFVLLTRARVSLGVNDARIMMARMHGVLRRGSVHVVRSAAPHARARSSPATQIGRNGSCLFVLFLLPNSRI